MKICDLLTENHIVFDLKPGAKEKVLSDFVRELKKRSLIQNDKIILRELLKRESLGSTGLEKGIAIPHALTKENTEPFLALALIKKGTDFEALDQMPTYILLLLLGNVDKPSIQLRVLAHVCRLVKETPVVEKIRMAKKPEEVCRVMSKEEEKIG
jgi:PTS system nitrogen regulatory IIA component